MELPRIFHGLLRNPTDRFADEKITPRIGLMTHGICGGSHEDITDVTDGRTGRKDDP